jgi:hypothetical protein
MCEVAQQRAVEAAISYLESSGRTDDVYGELYSVRFDGPLSGSVVFLNENIQHHVVGDFRKDNGLFIHTTNWDKKKLDHFIKTKYAKNLFEWFGAQKE